MPSYHTNPSIAKLTISFDIPRFVFTPFKFSVLNLTSKLLILSLYKPVASAEH
jgi:hypothetical protein